MSFIFIASLGFIIITPLMLSIYISIYLRDLFNLSDYVVIIGLFLGIISGVYSAYRIIMKKGNDNDK